MSLTQEQRERLESWAEAEFCGLPTEDARAIRAALAEVDQLTAELARANEVYLNALENGAAAERELAAAKAGAERDQQGITSLHNQLSVSLAWSRRWKALAYKGLDGVVRRLNVDGVYTERESLRARVRELERHAAGIDSMPSVKRTMADHRVHAFCTPTPVALEKAFAEADELLTKTAIERDALRAENKRLKVAMKNIEQFCDGLTVSDEDGDELPEGGDMATDIRNMARAALGGVT